MRSAGRNVTLRKLLARYGQAFTAFRATALEHQAAVLRAHTHQEPMRPSAARGVRLKRSFPFHEDSGDKRRIDNVSERLERVSIGSKVCYSRRPSTALTALTASPGLTPRACSVAAQSFPHLWKKLWKFDGNRKIAGMSGRKSRCFLEISGLAREFAPIFATLG
jgi:hypothetical protein